VRRSALIRFAGTADGHCFDGVPSLCIDAMLGYPHPVADSR
jgi:hypothetical protein